MMQNFEIRRTNEAGILSVDIKDILEALGDRAKATYWRISGVEGEPLDIVGYSFPAVTEIANKHETIDGLQLSALADGIRQTIWGEYSGFKHRNSKDAWIIIRFIDSTYIDIMSNDDDIAAILKRAFAEEN